LKDGKQEGLATKWYENGQQASEGNVKVGKVMTVIKWKPNGDICLVTNVKDGNGISVLYKMDGSEKERIYYKDGEKIEVEESKSNQLDLPEIENELDQLLLDSDISPSLPPPPIK
jgi:antitoxin component YwqK of YwqJK toxin-antitoxin module